MASDDRTQTRPEVGLVAADVKHGEDFYKTAQWSADGTTIITSTSDCHIFSYVLPQNLLSPDENESEEALADPEDLDDATFPSGRTSPKAGRFHRLKPQGRLCHRVPALALAPAPYFSLAHPAAQSVLVASRDLPIQLFPLFPGQNADDDDDDDGGGAVPLPLAGYPLIKTQTEAYIGPNSLLWPAPGTHFFAGAANLLALFDASRTCRDPPVVSVPTIPSTRHLRKGNGVGMRGVVSALSSQQEEDTAGLVAAGTWTRCIGLYDLFRTGGDCVATWSVRGAGGDAGGDAGGQDFPGSGIVQTLWSPCGRYLVVNERCSDGLLVYDIRGTGKLLCRLAGRPSQTHQRMTFDVYASQQPNAVGFEVWAGTQNGKAVVWENVGSQEGLALPPSWDWIAHDSAMGSTAMHPSGSVVATIGGSWELRPTDYSDDSQSSQASNSSDTSDSDSSEGSDESSESTDSDDTNVSNRATGQYGMHATRTSADVSLKIWNVV